MIGWLQGQLAEQWHQGQRCGALLVCQGVGYEVQLSQRHHQALPPLGSPLSLHVHHSVRDDGWVLYGFPAKQERDLFRELVAVSGVGPQMALGLLASLEPGALVQAIVQADLRRLSQAPGVGKRTAERLAVELRSRLQERFADLLSPALATVDPLADLHSEAVLPAVELQEELEGTLAALGYGTLEIQRAVRAVAATHGDQVQDSEVWLRDCLRWLAREAA